MCCGAQGAAMFTRSKSFITESCSMLQGLDRFIYLPCCYCCLLLLWEPFHNIVVIVAVSCSCSSPSPPSISSSSSSSSFSSSSSSQSLSSSSSSCLSNHLLHFSSSVFYLSNYDYCYCHMRSQTL